MFALDVYLARYADNYPGARAYHLAVWHGPTVALALSGLVLISGTAVYAWTAHTSGWRRWRLPTDGAAGYEPGDRLAVRTWLIVGVLALSFAWVLKSALLVVIGLSALGVGITWWAVPVDIDSRVPRDGKIPR